MLIDSNKDLVQIRAVDSSNLLEPLSTAPGRLNKAVRVPSEQQFRQA